jgi:formylglycine-generating enzyme required for sulfatase activity
MKDPKYLNKGDGRVLRGGAGDCNAEYCRAEYCRAASRYKIAPGAHYYYFGLRVCFRLD